MFVYLTRGVLDILHALKMGEVVTMSWKGCIDEKATVFI